MRSASQALVEFALAISIFMLLVLGTFDLARAYLAYTVVANVAREASRYGAAHCASGACDLTGARQAGLNLAVGVDPASVSLVVDTVRVGTLTYVRVQGSYPFHSLTPLVRALLGDPINLTVSTAAPAG
jgi:Flp pilus assembly protein TadG